MSSTPIPDEDDQDRTSDSEGSWSSAGGKMNGGPPDTGKMNGGPHEDDKEEDAAEPDDGGNGSSGR
ncbi:MAG: hypothetical protein WAL67_05640 [Candidatus Cybelea sp.]